MIGRLNINHILQRFREVGLYLMNKIHFRYAVIDWLKKQRRPKYRSIGQLSDLEPKDRQYYKVKKFHNRTILSEEYKNRHLTCLKFIEKFF